MQKKNTNLPLTYVLAQVKFSNIESIEKYIPEIQEDIRAEFPFFNKIQVDTVQIQPNVSPITSTVTLWHFMNKESILGILLDSSSITIHTSKYTSFSDLSEEFGKILEILNNRLKISMYTRLGLRYVNVITSDLIESVRPELLGLNLNIPHLKRDKFFSKTEVTQESESGIVKLNSLHFGNKDILTGINNYFVNPELSQMAQFLSFKHLTEPSGEFLIFDIDHFQNKSSEFSIEEIISQISTLKKVIRDIFYRQPLQMQP